MLGLPSLERPKSSIGITSELENCYIVHNQSCLTKMIFQTTERLK